MLFKLSLKNIRKSIKDYAIYFFTLILGVAIFYVFNAIDSQTVMLKATKNMTQIIKLMTNMLSGVSVFVSVILGFLVIYASRFLIKRRNKEFGIYLTLGMSKRKISLILFFETLFIGVISLAIGLGLGAVLSQAMSILVANMFEADMTNFHFIFSKAACIKTLIYFGIMYLLVMIFNTIIVSKCKLIDLINASRKTEKVKLKNTFVCVLIFILAAGTLGYAYYLVTAGFAKLDTVNKIFIPIVLGGVSTFFVFWSLSGLLLKIFMSFKKLYYKGLNSFTLRQVSSKINTMVFSMTIICLMLFVTICVSSSALSIKESMTKNLNDLAPVDVQLTKIIFDKEDEVSNEEVRKDFALSVEETMEKNGFSLKDNLKDMVTFNIYKTKELTLGNSLNDNFDEVSEKYKYLRYDAEEKIMRISDYNKVAKLYGNKTYTLKDNEYMVIADFDSMIRVRNISLKSGQTITLNNKKYLPKYDSCQDGFVEISSNHVNDGIILIPDDAIESARISHKVVIGNYNASSKEEKIKMGEKVKRIAHDIWDNTSLISVNNKSDIAESSIGLGALVTFIGLYLGIIFLVSSAAILALKELSESTDNKERYRMLRKLGADEKMINKALFRQIAIFFMFPLLVAIIHSYFGIKFCVNFLETFGKTGLLPSIIMTSIFLIVIYGGYFLITYYCSKNIIREKR